MARNNAGLRTHGYCGKGNAFLGHELVRLSLDSAHQAFTGCHTHQFGKLRVLSEPWESRLDHQLLEMFLNVVAAGLLAPPPQRPPRRMRRISAPPAAQGPRT